MKKHPHARGEDLAGTTKNFLQRETPPRTWGRPGRIADLMKHNRNTPTHVGKTLPLREMQLQFWKHPHARGEDRP